MLKAIGVLEDNKLIRAEKKFYFNAGTSDYRVTYVSGLSSIEAPIKSEQYSNRVGEYYVGYNIGSRVVEIDIEIVNRTNVTSSVNYLHKIFQIATDKMIYIEDTELGGLYVNSYIEQIEREPFSSNPTITIKARCVDPYIYSLKANTINIPGRGSVSFTTDLTFPTPYILEIIASGNGTGPGTISFRSDPRNTAANNVTVAVSDVRDNDRFYFNTDPNKREAFVYPAAGGVNSLISKVTGNFLDTKLNPESPLIHVDISGTGMRGIKSGTLKFYNRYVSI